MRTLLLPALLLFLAWPRAAAADGIPPRELRLTLSDPAMAPAAESSGAGDLELDFDLLGTPDPAPATPGQPGLRLRRRMLDLHQGMGLGLLAFTAASVVIGQLNYNDRFAGGPSTGRFELSHAAVSYGTLGLFTATGLAAILAPDSAEPPHEGFDRVTLHKIGLFTAAAGMAAQAVLGLVSTGREGYVNQQGFATAHLAVGYLTFAGMALGVGALVF